MFGPRCDCDVPVLVLHISILVYSLHIRATVFNNQIGYCSSNLFLVHKRSTTRLTDDFFVWFVTFLLRRYTATRGAATEKKYMNSI